VRTVSLWLLIFLGGWAGATPTCDELLARWSAAFDEAEALVVAVEVTEGTRELAFEVTQLQRRADGTFARTTLERRGWPRPPGMGAIDSEGGEPFDCAAHTLDLSDEDTIALHLAEPDPSAMFRSWSLHFVASERGWWPQELRAPFEVRVLWWRVRGELTTTFSDWSFASE